MVRSGTLRPDSANGNCQYRPRGANFCCLSLSCDSVFKILLPMTSGQFAKSCRGEIKLVCNGVGGATSRDCSFNSRPEPHRVGQVVLMTLPCIRFQAQDDAGGPQRRRPDQSLPSARSQAEERHRHRTERVGPAEQNLPLSDLRRPCEL